MPTEPGLVSVFPEFIFFPFLRGGKFLRLGPNVLRILKPRLSVKFSEKQLRKKFKHAKYFNIKGNPNAQNLEKFRQAIQRHINAKDTITIRGTYRGKKVVHYIDPKTNINVMTDKSGNFISGWELKGSQLKHVINNGKLGGG